MPRSNRADSVYRRLRTRLGRRPGIFGLGLITTSGGPRVLINVSGEELANCREELGESVEGVPIEYRTTKGFSAF